MADTQEPLFDPSLKKKKGTKKTVDFSGLDDEQPAPAAAAAAPAESSEQAAPAGDAAEDDMFGGLKKKKKSKKAIPMDLDLVSPRVCAWCVARRARLTEPPGSSLPSFCSAGPAHIIIASRGIDTGRRRFEASGLRCRRRRCGPRFRRDEEEEEKVEKGKL